jgi:hypothetical protein
MICCWWFPSTFYDSQAKLAQAAEEGEDEVAGGWLALVDEKKWLEIGNNGGLSGKK